MTATTLFSPLTLGALNLSHRVVMAPRARRDVTPRSRPRAGSS